MDKHHTTKHSVPLFENMDELCKFNDVVIERIRTEVTPALQPMYERKLEAYMTAEAGLLTASSGRHHA